MINSFKIGTAIHSLLSQGLEDTDINQKIYPLVAAEGTDFPFIVYKRNNLMSNNSKDGIFEDSVNFEISIITETYSEGIAIAQKVRQTLEKETINTDDFTLNDTKIVSSTEQYLDNVFVQKITFNTKIN